MYEKKIEYFDVFHEFTKNNYTWATINIVSTNILFSLQQNGQLLSTTAHYIIEIFDDLVIF